MGAIRLRIQYRGDDDLPGRMAFTIIFIVLVIYTCVFAIMYLKRALYMAFLTMIAPLVALTYPLDKIKDGSAQAFNMWMREYLFNALIQPFHLILYYLVVGTAIDLVVNDNPLFGLVAIGFLIPAEKLLRKFFGFEKAGTAKALGGALGGAMVMNAINSANKVLGGGISKRGSEGGNGAQGNGEVPGGRPVRTADSGYNMAALIGGISGGEGAGIGTVDGGNMSFSGDDGLSGDGGHRMLNSDGGEDGIDGVDFDDDGFNFDDAFGDTELGFDEDGIGSDDGSIRMDDLDGLGETEASGPSAIIEPPNEETHRLLSAVSLLGRYTAKGSLRLAGMAAKGTAAATLGTIGMAAGLASDDYKNVLTYGLAGAGAGLALGNAVENKVKKLPSDAYKTKEKRRELREEYESMAYSPERRKEMQNTRADKEFLKNEAAIEIFKNEFGTQEYKRAMQDAIEYRRYGVTDNNAIIKAMKLGTRGLGDRKSSSRILIAKTAPNLSRNDMDKFSERLSKHGKGKSADIITQGIRDFNDFE